MEEKINIAAILKDKPQGTKLYNLLYNIDVELDTIVNTGTETIVWCTDKIDNNDMSLVWLARLSHGTKEWTLLINIVIMAIYIWFLTKYARMAIHLEETKINGYYLLLISRSLNLQKMARQFVCSLVTIPYGI